LILALLRLTETEIHVPLAKKDAISAKMVTDANNARKTSSLKKTFALIAAMLDTLK
jgi:hypothetical protein